MREIDRPSDRLLFAAEGEDLLRQIPNGGSVLQLTLERPPLLLGTLQRGDVRHKLTLPPPAIGDKRSASSVRRAAETFAPPPIRNDRATS
jgi:hypothetical protein